MCSLSYCLQVYANISLRYSVLGYTGEKPLRILLWFEVDGNPAQWWPSVQKAKFAGQPTNLLSFRDDGEVSVSYENFESWSEGTIAIFEMVEQALITPLPQIPELQSTLFA